MSSPFKTSFIKPEMKFVMEIPNVVVYIDCIKTDTQPRSLSSFFYPWPRYVERSRVFFLCVFTYQIPRSSFF